MVLRLYENWRMFKNKSYLKIGICLIVITAFIILLWHGIFKVQAKTNYTAYITGDVNFRSKPTTSYNEDGTTNIIGEIDLGETVTVVSNEIQGTHGCSKGFINIIYNNVSGYVCSTYVGLPDTDAYNRPWNTPKKAIVNGAKWISSGYISRGQFTSYLKKFNVNPNADSYLYNHQYQTNIAAPSSESVTTYNAYKNTGFLELPFVFNIPIFNNMGEKYDRPIGNLATVKALDEVVNTEFESTLDKEGFPESYKRILRYLHSIHPTWQFVAMQTNEDFNYAVEQERLAGAIDIKGLYPSEKPELVEGSRWFRPTSEAVAYYLDPRNFLTEKYIFQFEALNYSEKYTEELVQGVLNNTFMSGNDLVDNQSYKSIFVEAGKANDISPLYLASLARQELGTKGSVASSGAKFSYNGNDYQGVYNFFNIEARSGVYDGLLYATGGYCRICSNFIPVVNPDDSSSDEDKNNSNNELTSKEIIEKLGLVQYNSYLKGFKVSTTISSLKAQNLSVNYGSDNIVKTGMSVTFSDGVSYTAVIYGDLTGDGEINSADLLRLRQHLLGKSNLNGAYKEASDLTGDGLINSADLLKLRQYLLGQTNINQL